MHHTAISHTLAHEIYAFIYIYIYIYEEEISLENKINTENFRLS